MTRVARCAIWLALVGLVACGNDEPTGPVAVASVEVTPNPASVPLGETVLLSATPKDQAGNTLSGRTITWTSANASIATVDVGTVRGVAEGTTTVSAVSEGTVGSVAVTVAPARVNDVQVRPQNGSVLIGETLQMTATPRSASGTPLAGRSVTWSSSDPQVATVSPSGVVQGVAGGPVTITATVELRSGSAPVEIVDPTAPRVNAVTPFPMVVGESATITGVNFGATVGENAVTVDGSNATVTAADATSITFTVPATGCRPVRDVSVRVTAGGKSGARMHPVRPAAFTQVGIGEQLVLPGPPCLQLDATNAFETYLVGVVSLNPSAGSLLGAELTGRIGLAAGAGSVARPGPGLVSGSAWEVPGGSRDGDWPTEPAPRYNPGQQDVLVAHATRHVTSRAAEGAALRAAPPDLAAARSGALQSVIPPNAQVGQTFSVRVPPPFPGSCTQTVSTITAELRLITNRAFWLVDQANLTGGYTAADLQTLATAFDDRVAPALEATFGPIPDTDSDGRVAFVVTQWVNQQGWLSYSNLSDYRPRSECPASNEGDWAYLSTPQVNTSFTRDFLMSVMPHSLAHDFTHVIQNRAVIAGGARPDAWIEEGQATLGEEVFAHALSNPARAPRQNYGSTVIFSQTGSAQPYSMVSGLALYYGFQGSSQPKIAGAPQQCTWLQPSEGGTPPGPCDAGAAMSGSWAFLRWLTDHFAAAVGGDGAFHQALIDGSGPGFDRVTALAGLPIETLLSRFGAALYVDDRVSLQDALLGFPSWNLFDMEQNVFQQARLAPFNYGYQDFTQAVSIRGGSTAYFRITGPGRPATAVEFTGPAGAALGPDLRVWVVRVE